LQTRTETFECDETWSRCVGRLNELDRSSRIEGFVGRYAWGLCGAFALVIAVGGYWSRMAHTGVISSSDVPREAASMFPVPGVRSMSDFKQWVGQKLGFESPQIQDTRLNVACVYQGTLDGMPAVRLALQDSDGNADLTIVHGAQAVDGVRPLQDGQFSVGRVNGENLVTWTRDGSAMLLVSPRSMDQLVDLASEIRVR